MRTTEQLDYYFQQVQQLASRAKGNSSSLQELLQYILQRKEAAHASNPPHEKFFQAEYDFFSGKYQLALKHYLQIKANPYFKLCCYRTSAYVSKSRGEISKALTFAQEALAINEKDYPSLSILEELFNLNEQPDNAQEIRSRLNGLDEEYLTKETPMHTPPGFLSSPDSKATDQLTNRLYTLKDIAAASSPFARSEKEPLPDSNHPTHEGFMIDTTVSTCHGTEQTESLEQSIKSYQKRQEAATSQYLEQLKRRPLSNDYCMHVLHGYPPCSNQDSISTELLLTDKERRTSGGYYIRWNGKGIVINPGNHFLEHFDRHGLHIRDIDYVIVTNANHETYADIKEIYDLNYQLNNANADLHVIHYYLSQKAYQTLSHALKPHFKQERNSIKCLELFLDSPDVEKIELSEGIVLHYFPAANHAAVLQHASHDNTTPLPAYLGIRLDLTIPHEHKTVRLGYVSGATWSPLLSHHLGQCDVLIAGFGSTNANDYGKVKYNENSLGYFGSFSLLEEVNPQLFITSEFNGNQGDIRLEVIKLMRQEYAKAYPTARLTPAVLPADPNLYLDLRNLNIQCSITRADVPPAQARIVKTQAGFGSLRYLSPQCCA